MDVNISSSSAVDSRLLQRLGVRVKQSMSGRLRVRVKPLRRKPEELALIAAALKQHPAINRVETRPATGSLIVWFNGHEMTVREVLAEIAGLLLNRRTEKQQRQTERPLNHSAACPACATCESCDHHSEADFPTKVRRVLLLSGFMVWSLARLWIFRLPLVQTPLSVLGAAAMLGTVPLVKEAVADSLAKKKVTVKPFLAAGAIATIALGEAFSALQILWIYNMAEMTEDYVARRSRQAIKEILEVAPATAFVIADGVELETAVGDIRPGDIVVTHTGEKIAVDGIVERGEALVDEASLNGRAENIARRTGDRVYAGTLVTQGTLFIVTEKTGEATFLANIMRLVEESMSTKAPVEQKADQLAGRLLRIGLAATAVTFALTLDPLRALTVMLVMSCPCATVLAASSAVTAALANAARHSVLIKGGLYLEMAGRAEVYCLDKTGTLTSEEPQVLAIITRTPAVSEEKILQMAATAESHNQHPMARAIIAAAKSRGLAVDSGAVCEFTPGRGVSCSVQKDRVLVGNRAFVEENGSDVRWFDRQAAEQKKEGNTVIYVVKNGKLQGMLGIANPVRRETIHVLNRLKEDGIREIHLISGDSTEVAATMQRTFAFDSIQGDLMPEQKAEYVEKMQQTAPVVMVGDGVNDALALARADIGVAMGAAGAEVALEAADIALADSNLDGLLMVRELSRKTMAVVDQNHWFAVSTDLLGAALGMAGMLSPIMAGAIHIFHTGGILINSSLLLQWQAPSSRQPQIQENRDER